MPRDMVENERSTAINPSEAVQEKVSLSDRFGLWLGFHNCSQDDYLAMVARLYRDISASRSRGRGMARPRRSNGRPPAAAAPAASPGSMCRTSPGGRA